MNFFLFMYRNGNIITIGEMDIDTLLYAKATTMTWATIAFCQLANVMSQRYEFTSIFNRNFFSNRKLLVVIILTIGLILTAIYLPAFSYFLYFGPLNLVDWMYIGGATAIFLAAFEIMKAGKRHRQRKNVNGQPAGLKQ
jgi:Ca2+-transporting ATPase